MHRANLRLKFSSSQTPLSGFVHIMQMLARFGDQVLWVKTICHVVVTSAKKVNVSSMSVVSQQDYAKYWTDLHQTRGMGCGNDSLNIVGPGIFDKSVNQGLRHRSRMLYNLTTSRWWSLFYQWLFLDNNLHLTDMFSIVWPQQQYVLYWMPF